jgi:hypothetical protein
MSTADIWTFREDVAAADMSGYDVETLDGSIGEPDEAAGASARLIAVLTWISGSKVVLPALIVSGIDHEAKKIYVSRTSDEIKDAPAFDEAYRRGARRIERSRDDGSDAVGEVGARATPAPRQPMETDARTTAPCAETIGRSVFRYQLVDIAGRYVDTIERSAPLRTDEKIVLDRGEAWRIVAVLGTSATVARA